MSIVVTTEVKCDFPGCEKHGGAAVSSKIQPNLAQSNARDDGWVREDGKDYCRQHKPKIVPMYSLGRHPVHITDLRILPFDADLGIVKVSA